MRVISGRFKGKRLVAPSNKNVRPTTDRIKESIFNILINKCDIAGSSVLDLFCGSGALGIEALSRYANYAIFIDNDKNSIKLTMQNLLAMQKIFVIDDKDIKYDSTSMKNVNLAALPNNNLNKTQYASQLDDSQCQARVFLTSFEVAAKKLKGQKFDIIFVDPPYFDNIAERAIFLIEKYDILSQNGIIVYEYYDKNGLPTIVNKFIIDERNFGSVSVCFLSKPVK